MKIYNIEISKKAKEDLYDIVRYIRYNLHEPQIAIKLYQKIKNNIYNIAKSPKIYSIIDDGYLKKFEIRKCVIDNYIIFYQVKELESKVIIVRILYGRRNWINML